MPVTVYGAAKLAGEFYARAYYQTYGLPVVIVRPFNAYGPREHERGDLAEVIPRFVIRLLNGLPPIVFGNGENGRDFTYVSDTVRGIAKAASCDALLGGIVNIAYGRMISIRELWPSLSHGIAAGLKSRQCSFLRGRGMSILCGPIPRRAQDVLDFRAEIPFEDGLARYIDWFRAQHNDPSALLEDEPCNWQMPKA